MYAETGISARIKDFRIMFDNRSDLIRDLNKYKHYSNVYHSIYWYKRKEQKFDLEGKFKRWGPDYLSAQIDKIVLDIDAYQKKNGYEFYTDKALFDMRTLEEWADNKNILREYRFSGGGFYFIFAAKGDPLKLRDYTINLQNTLDIRIDPSVIGDTSRMMRVTNSFNFKKHRKRFCIPLKKEELYLTFNEIKERAKEQRPYKRFIYGEHFEDFSRCKIDKSKITQKHLHINVSSITEQNADEILKKYGWRFEELCDTIKSICSLEHVGNSLRIELIKYFRTVVHMSYEDCVTIMVSLLGGEGMHSVIEGQAKYAYTKNYVFTPKKLKGLGYCPMDCHECEKLRDLPYKVCSTL